MLREGSEKRKRATCLGLSNKSLVKCGVTLEWLAAHLISGLRFGHHFHNLGNLVIKSYKFGVGRLEMNVTGLGKHQTEDEEEALDVH